MEMTANFWNPGAGSGGDLRATAIARAPQVLTFVLALALAAQLGREAPREDLAHDLRAHITAEGVTQRCALARLRYRVIHEAQRHRRRAGQQRRRGVQHAAAIDEVEHRRAEARARRKLRGIGLSNTIERAAAGGFEAAEIRFDRGGVSYTVLGSVPPAAAQAAARGL